MDDNLVNARVLKKAIESFSSCPITSVENGLDALSWFLQFGKSGARTDRLLILMDLEMPILDGHDAACSIRDLCTKLHWALPFIVCASAGTGRGESSVFDEKLPKPINLAKLASILKNE